MRLRQKFSLAIRSRTLKKQFKAQYIDLLSAIQNQNYAALEAICEQNLTLELASKIFEWSKFQEI